MDVNLLCRTHYFLISCVLSPPGAFYGLIHSLVCPTKIYVQVTSRRTEETNKAQNIKMKSAFKCLHLIPLIFLGAPGDR